MKVTFKAAQKIGNRSFPKGEQTIPDSVAYNTAFKGLVSKGLVQIHARDEAQVKVRMAHDAKQFAKAQIARKEKSLQSANAASGAVTHKPSAAGSVQILHTPTKPVSAGSAKVLSAPAQDEE